MTTINTPKSVTRHIVIAGPGRSGTTLLVRLLAELGLDVGTPKLGYFDHAKAGLEGDLLDPNAPYVIKNPDLSWLLREMLDQGKVEAAAVEWLVVPLRRLDQASASRVRVSAKAGDPHSPGGLIRTSRPSRLRQHLAEATYGLFETAALYELPLILLEYPRFAHDSPYAFRQLRPMLPGVTQSAFDSAWVAVVDPELVRVGDVQVPKFARLRIAAISRARTVKARLRGRGD